MRRKQSLRGRIAMLALVTCVFLAVAALLLFRSVRAGQAATQAAVQKHLGQLASTVADRYLQQEAHGTSLRNLAALAQSSATAPVRRAPKHAESEKPSLPEPPPPPPAPEPSDELSSLTEGVLGKQEDLQGGFVAAGGAVLGYAASAEDGLPTPPLPPHERSLVQQVGQRTIDMGGSQSSTVRGARDVLVLVTQPIVEGSGSGSQTVGAVWMLQRLPNAERGQSLQLLLTGAGFGGAALVTALLAWFLIAEVQGGVSAVTRRLANVQGNLNQPPPAETGTHVAEFEHLVAGIDGMAAALRSRIANERALEEELRHKERLSSLGQFAAGVAHELRNPLATIRLRAQMSQYAAADTARNSGVILEEVDRLDRMIGRLLQFARPLALDRTTMDVSALCHEVRESWSKRTQDGVCITCSSAEGAILCGDRSRLHQVLDNLVENAVQASKPGDPIALETTVRNDAVTIRVLDRGTGLDAGARTHAMDPFFTTKASGTGLGLSIAFEIVAAHNGTLTLEPREGGGVVVTMTLPKNEPGEERNA